MSLGTSEGQFLFVALLLSCSTKRLDCRLNNSRTNTLANTLENTNKYKYTRRNNYKYKYKQQILSIVFFPNKTDEQTLRSEWLFILLVIWMLKEVFYPSSDDPNDNGFPAGMGRRDNKWVSWQMEKRGGQPPASHSHFQKYFSRLQNVCFTDTNSTWHRTPIFILIANMLSRL